MQIEHSTQVSWWSKLNRTRLKWGIGHQDIIAEGSLLPLLGHPIWGMGHNASLGHPQRLYSQLARLGKRRHIDCDGFSNLARISLGMPGTSFGNALPLLLAANASPAKQGETRPNLHDAS